MGNFEQICTMGLEDLIKGVLGQGQPAEVPQQATDQALVQPTDNVGEFGKSSGIRENNISVEGLECGGVMVKSPDMNIKLSKEVVNAIKNHIGASNNE